MAAIVLDNVTYGKPNMAALEGDLGRRILDAIASTPRPDFERLDRECAEVNRRMLEAKANGTF